MDYEFLKKLKNAGLPQGTGSYVNPAGMACSETHKGAVFAPTKEFILKNLEQSDLPPVVISKEVDQAGFPYFLASVQYDGRTQRKGRTELEALGNLWLAVNGKEI